VVEDGDDDDDDDDSDGGWWVMRRKWILNVDDSMFLCHCYYYLLC